jgi:DNA repair protein RadC
MHINEATLAYQVLTFDAADRLATTRQLLAYLTAGVPDTGEESFWIACLNPNRRPICRTRIKIGPMVASRVTMRDVFLPLLLAEAKAFACLRLHPESELEPKLNDGRLLWNLRETARLMNIELVDYLIASLDGRAYHSWREHDRRGA